MHINIPKAAIPRDVEKRTEYIYYPGTYLLNDGSIVVNIDITNIELLFGNPQNDKEMKTFQAVMRLLQFVNPPK